MKFVLGVDEAGRGPLAGPVAVGVVAVRAGFDVAKEFPGVADSKILSEKKREEIYELLKARAGVAGADISFCVMFGSHLSIDTKGIAPTIRACVARGVRKLAPEARGVHIYLDGSLRAPVEYAQETIIDGDALSAQQCGQQDCAGLIPRGPLYLRDERWCDRHATPPYRDTEMFFQSEVWPTPVSPNPRDRYVVVPVATKLPEYVPVTV